MGRKLKSGKATTVKAVRMTEDDYAAVIAKFGDLRTAMEHLARQCWNMNKPEKKVAKKKIQEVKIYKPEVTMTPGRASRPRLMTAIKKCCVCGKKSDSPGVNASELSPICLTCDQRNNSFYYPEIDDRTMAQADRGESSEKFVWPVCEEIELGMMPEEEEESVEVK